MEANKESQAAAAPNMPKPAVAGVSVTAAALSASAASEGDSRDLVKRELMPAPCLKRPREVEDWLLHPPDGSVSKYCSVGGCSDVCVCSKKNIFEMSGHRKRSRSNTSLAPASSVVYTYQQLRFVRRLASSRCIVPFSLALCFLPEWCLPRVPTTHDRSKVKLWCCLHKRKASVQISPVMYVGSPRFQ